MTDRGGWGDVDAADAVRIAPGRLFTYRHENGRCSIRGGVLARGDEAGSLAGQYLFADYCSGEVIALPISGVGDDIIVGAPSTLLTTTHPTAVVAGPDGTRYVLSADAVNRLDV